MWASRLGQQPKVCDLSDRHTLLLSLQQLQGVREVVLNERAGLWGPRSLKLGPGPTGLALPGPHPTQTHSKCELSKIHRLPTSLRLC